MFSLMKMLSGSNYFLDPHKMVFDQHYKLHRSSVQLSRVHFPTERLTMLIEVKDYLAEGINMAGIKQIYAERAQEEAKRQAKREKSLTDADVRRILRVEYKPDFLTAQSL